MKITCMSACLKSLGFKKKFQSHCQMLSMTKHKTTIVYLIIRIIFKKTKTKTKQCQQYHEHLVISNTVTVAFSNLFEIKIQRSTNKKSLYYFRIYCYLFLIKAYDPCRGDILVSEATYGYLIGRNIVVNGFYFLVSFYNQIIPESAWEFCFKWL